MSVEHTRHRKFLNRMIQLSKDLRYAQRHIKRHSEFIIGNQKTLECGYLNNELVSRLRQDNLKLQVSIKRLKEIEYNLLNPDKEFKL